MERKPVLFRADQFETGYQFKATGFDTSALEFGPKGPVLTLMLTKDEMENLVRQALSSLGPKIEHKRPQGLSENI